MEPWQDPPDWMKALIAMLPSWIQDKLYPETNPYTLDVMRGVLTFIECIVPAFIPLLEAYWSWFSGEYASWEGYTPIETVPAMTPPEGQEHEPAPVTGSYSYDWILGQINDGVLTTLDFLGPWVAPDNLHVQIQAIENSLAALTGSGTPTTAKDTARILAAVYYLAWLLWNNPIPADMTEVLAAVSDAVTAINENVDDVDTNIDGVATAIQGRFDTIDGSLASLLSGEGDILDAIAAIEPAEATAGAPVWPGLANVTLGEGVSLVDGLHITGAMDGVLISITTPPTKTGLILVGGATFDYREGQVAFESDNGEIETWQYLGFRQAIFTPKTMKQASGARFRVLAGAEGTVYPWTIT